MTSQSSSDAASANPGGAPAVDHEIAAIQAVLIALRDLKPDERVRVLAYVFERLGLNSSVVMPSTLLAVPGGSPPSVTASAATSEPGDHEEGRPRDIRTFKEQKQPKSAIEMAALVAYYLAELAPASYKKTAIATDDINTYFKQADFPLPTAPRQTLFNAKAAGYFDSADRGSFRLNPVGHNLVVHGLPSEVEGATAGSRGRGLGRKGSRRIAKRSKSK